MYQFRENYIFTHCIIWSVNKVFNSLISFTSILWFSSSWPSDTAHFNMSWAPGTYDIRHTTHDTGMHDSILCGLWCLFHQQGPRQLQEAQDAGQHVKRQGDVGLAFLFEMRSHHSPLLLLPKRIKHCTLIFWKSRIWRAHYYCPMLNELWNDYKIQLSLGLYWISFILIPKLYLKIPKCDGSHPDFHFCIHLLIHRDPTMWQKQIQSLNTAERKTK